MPTLREQNAQKKLTATIVGVVIVAVVVVGADQLRGRRTTAMTELPVPTSSTPTTTPTTSGASSSAGSTMSASGYKNGTYSVSNSYRVPHGDEAIKVNVTLQNGIVTNVAIVNSENDPTSAQYQEDFDSRYKTYVIGKPIAGLGVGAVAGASDTAQAFNDALGQITSQAQA